MPSASPRCAAAWTALAAADANANPAFASTLRPITAFAAFTLIAFAGTRYVRRQVLDNFCAEDGEKPYKLLLPKHIRKRRDARADRPESANAFIKALRQVFKYAVDNDYVVSNLAQAVPYLKAKGDGHHTWMLEEVERFERTHPIGSTARLALALMIYTGQRRSDAVLLGPNHFKDGWLHFTQFKGRERKPITLDVPILPELQRIIDATACGTDTSLLNG